MNLGGRLEQVPWWLLPFPELHSIPGHTVCSVTSIEVRVPSLTGLQCVSLTVSASGRMLTETAKNRSSLALCHLHSHQLQFLLSLTHLQIWPTAGGLLVWGGPSPARFPLQMSLFMSQHIRPSSPCRERSVQILCLVPLFLCEYTGRWSVTGLQRVRLFFSLVFFFYITWRNTFKKSYFQPPFMVFGFEINWKVLPNP